MLKKIKNIASIIPVVILAGYAADAQVDEDWLNRWNEALKSQPPSITAKSLIAPKTEPGERLVIYGRVFNPDETPAKEIVVHAYHRDSNGFDFGKNDEETATWRLQGWAKTDENGHFEFQTIKPKADHLGREGAHIHFTTMSKRYGNQWAPKVYLADDPLVTDSQKANSKKAGKYGWVCQVKEVDEIQFIELSIRLKNKKDF